ncbi:hypothetical protein, variant [Fonticula alba]|uniref:ATP-dependent RNA helicase n=1 Tax=Fonticula alba TaxID=691883 RepID=A0A058Z5Q8_FONAL|nr:hypothetical protein, variant [Fonticula alba]KCV69590.1 hypothetical protein, variant [Fonticula alba]|eukprot:XP_009496155.1 hypothetical protein, variant [Fonticula alba]
MPPGKKPAPSLDDWADDLPEAVLKQAAAQAGPARAVVSSLFTNNPTLAKRSDPLPDVSTLERTNAALAEANFDTMGLDPRVVRALRDRLGVQRPTAIQHQAIPAILSGQDVIMRAQTGSGKTLSFLLPILQHLLTLSPQVSRGDGALCMVIVPTRELAAQTQAVLERLIQAAGCVWIVSGALAGGERRKAEKARLRRGLNIVIGTPGRLKDHLDRTAGMDLSQVGWVVLDEADLLLDLGFEKDVREILKTIDERRAVRRIGVPRDRRQTILCSATISKRLQAITQSAMESPVYISTDETLVAGAQPAPDAEAASTTAPMVIEPAPDMAPDAGSDVAGDAPSKEGEDAKMVDTELGERFHVPAQLLQIYYELPTKLRLVTLVTLLQSRLGVTEDQLQRLDQTLAAQAASETAGPEGADADSTSKPTAATPKPAGTAPKSAAALAAEKALGKRPSATDKPATDGAPPAAEPADPALGFADPKRGIVFLSTTDSVDFHFALLTHAASRPVRIDNSGAVVLFGEKPADGEAAGDGSGSDSDDDAAAAGAQGSSASGPADPDQGASLFDSDEEDGGAAGGGSRAARARRQGRARHIAELSSSFDPVTGKPLQRQAALTLSAWATAPILGGARVYRLHGDMAQADRMATFRAYREGAARGEAAVLLCSDVAARGVDLPQVDFVVQYDVATSVRDYVHRIGRTARAGREGTSIVFLMPHEAAGYTEFLRTNHELVLLRSDYEAMLIGTWGGRAKRAHRLAVKQAVDRAQRRAGPTARLKHEERERIRRAVRMPDWRELLTGLQRSFERQTSHRAFHKLSVRALRSYIRAYATHPKAMRAFFHPKQLHLGHLAKRYVSPGSFGGIPLVRVPAG